MKRIVVLLNEHNFIDHVTPIVDVVIGNDEYECILLKLSENYDYNNDANLQYLLTKYRGVSIYDIYLNKSKLFSILHNIKILYAHNQCVNPGLVGRFTAAISTRLYNRYRKKNPIAVDVLVKNLVADIDKTVFVSDQSEGDGIGVDVLKYISLRGYINLSFHHGVNIFLNKLVSNFDLNCDVKHEPWKLVEYATKLIVYNSIGVNHLKELSKETSWDKIIQLPSLRNTSAWMQKKLGLVKKLELSDDEKCMHKIVYMVSSENYNIWCDEEIRTLKTILTIEGVRVIVKPHPRTLKTVADLRKLNNENLIVVDNSVTSTELIDWSDLVIVISSGIFLEALIKNKPILYAKYLHCNKIDFERFPNIARKAETRDDTVRIIANDEYRDIKKLYLSEREEFLRDYILNDDFEENSMKYVELFESSFADSKVLI